MSFETITFPNLCIGQIDHVPTFAENSVFACTGGSGHGAKFLPVLGQVRSATPQTMRDLLIATYSTPRIYWRKETKAHPSCESSGAGVPTHHEGTGLRKALADRETFRTARFEYCLLI